MVTYENRYGDKYIFILKDFETIEVKGDFSMYRLSPLLDYADEYNKSIFDLDLYKFIDTKGIGKPTEYQYMIDPTGGPYLVIGMDLGSILPQFKNLIITKIKVIDEKGCILNYYIK